jgi:hypothetical protein
LSVHGSRIDGGFCWAMKMPPSELGCPPIRKQSCCDSGFRNYDPAGPVVPSFGPRNQLMMSVNSNAAPFEPVRLTIAVIDEQDCVRVCWEVQQRH